MNTPLKIVDTHQHLWSLKQFDYSWLEGIPALNENFLLGDYVEAAKGCGIAKTVFMEADVDEPHLLDEARHIELLAEEYPLIAGIVAGGRPEKEDFADHLKQLSRLSRVRGVRRVLHTEADETALQPRFLSHLKQLPDYGYTFDLCVLARQLPVGIQILERCPEVTFILDHCGIPDVKGKTFEPWRDHLRQIAACDNLAACKISGLVAYADHQSWTVDDLRPWFEHVIECFGWDRVVWGGDWPVCTLAGPLAKWVDATKTLLSSVPLANRDKLYHLNAERIYRV